MIGSKEMRNDYRAPQEIYNHLAQVLRSSQFIQKQGLGNEIPFFICPYNPAAHVEMERIRKQLTSHLSQEGVKVLDINLYDLSIQLLEERKIWDKIILNETTWDKNKLIDLLRNVLDAEKHLIPAIAGLMEQNKDYEVMFLSGVGEIYPYIRSHTVLNNLQSTAKQQPTILFFPGTYTHSPEIGASLDLFGRLRDDKYYRAFNILHYNVQ